ncbi:MAG: membrane protein insertion efficiency factor YidD [Acidobacteria bacterium]|nr:membrane protein insertion efficiency factor YidD [Acidobacteriota bacterium]MCH8269222.1 membrane protein insertion efficiency factor YidD [Acidobacteriota bacterium]MCZ6753429.1 membrane protein insertion efficiency factor YidD [Acidobacteriota bacterium]
MKTILLALLGFYQQAISPVLPSSCKFYPTCSSYAADAVGKYGPAKGLWMAAARLLRCRPFHPGGYDPVS